MKHCRILFKIPENCEQSVENVASGRAIDELRENPELAKALLDAAQATPRTTESLTRQLVASFLMPSVEAVQDTHIAAREDTRLIGAAHETLQKSVENIVLHEK